MQQVLESENMVKSHAAAGLIENKEAELVKGIKTMVNVVVETLVTFNGDDGLIVANNEENSVFENMKGVFGDDEWLEVPNLKTQDRRTVNKEVKIVDRLMHNLVKKGMSVTQINRLLYTGAYVVADRLGLIRKKKKKRKQNKKPRWQRIGKSIGEWRKDLARDDELRKGTIAKKVMDQLNRKYQVIKKGSVAVATLLKQKIHSGSTKIRWYVNSCTKVRQNNLFKNNQSQWYKELGGRAKLGQIPNGEEATKFLSGIWSGQKRHDEDATWLGEVRDRMSGIEKQEVKIDIRDVEHGEV